MGNLRRYYYNNKSKIWKVILIIAFILGIIQFANFMVGKQNNIANNVTTNIPNSNTIINNTSLTTTNSATGGGNINTNKLEKDITIIDDFIKLCNNKNFENAYELLSQECKDNLFETLDKFKTNYCNNIFKTVQTYTSVNWSGNTYKVRMIEDILSTGQTVNGSMASEDYITVVENNGEKKLNINNYIGRTNINKSVTKDGITITVVSKDTYKDYEYYNISVENKTENTIFLDDGKSIKTMYVQDSNGSKYEVAISEVIYELLKIPSNGTRKYSIKYTNTYVSSRKINKLVFENIIPNYEKYSKNTNVYKDYLPIIIEF